MLYNHNPSPHQSFHNDLEMPPPKHVSMRSVRKIWGTSQPKSWTHEASKSAPWSTKVSPRIVPGYFSQKSHWGAIALISGVLLCVTYAGLSAGHLVPRPQELLRNTEETLWANNPGAQGPVSGEFS